MNIEILLVTSVHPPDDTRIYHKFLKTIKSDYGKTKLLLDFKNLENFKDPNIITYKNTNSYFKKIGSSFSILKKCLKIKPRLIFFFDPELIPIMLFIKIVTKTKVVFDNHEDYPSYIMVKEKIPSQFKILIKYSFLILSKISDYIFDYIIYADPFTTGYNAKDDKKIVIYNYPIFEQQIKYNKKYDLIFPGSVDLGILQMILNILLSLDNKMAFSAILIIRDLSDNNRLFLNNFIKKINNGEVKVYEDISYNEVQKYIGETKIGLLPLPNIVKFQKNIPTKLFEYCMHGLPIVGSELPPISHFTSHLESCFIIPYDNYEEKYVAIIEKLLTNYDHYNARSLKNKDTIKNNWNWNFKERNKLTSLVKKLIEC